MRSKTPPLNMLRAFEATARHESFSRAAEELHVTPGAVSQQVKALEDILGLSLFRREKQRLYLSDAGTNYLIPLKASFDRIEQATRTLLHHQGQGGEIKLGILPSLYTCWLLPKLPDFQEKHPDIGLNIVTLDLDFSGHLRNPVWEEQSLDVALFYGDGHWDGLKAEKVMEEILVPVASPHCVTGKNIKTAEDILSLPILYHSTRPQSWNEWAVQNGLTSISQYGYRLEHFHMLIDAARHGLGAALIPLDFLKQSLETGSLVRLPGAPLKPSRAYYMLSEVNHRDQASLFTFKEWLMNITP